ncbi:MAG: cell division protein ZipA C-terminal FtsZ-binding domain-containing protein [Pseudomonadota bacterium]
MTSFSVGIAMLGGLTLAGLIGYNAWSTRRNAPRQPEAPPAEPVAREPVEPAFRSDGEEDLATLPLPERKPGLDALIDVIAPIAVDTHVSGEAALAALPPTRRVGSKPFAVEGLNERTREWEAPRPGERYTAFQAGVQLANRNGALNDIEYSEYVVKAQAFADAIGGEPTFPEMLDEVARARELDQFAGAHDAQLGFTLRARQAAWSPGYVHQNAARLGFVVGAIPGRMVLPSAQPGSPAILGLAFDTQAALAEDPTQSAVREVTLSLDVPQVPRSEQPFVRMREAAIALAASMDGQITDDNGQVIRAEALDVIGADLEGLYDTLDARDVSAGSPQARRLFS